MKEKDPFDFVGKTLAGKYCVERLVEQTDISVVYRATHKLWRRPVAIKALRASMMCEGARRDLLDAFLREGMLLSELSEHCAAICQARDVASTTTSGGDWVPYMVLEWLEGEPLETLLQRERAAEVAPRSLAEAVRLLDPVADALAIAHERGVAHCDVKPGNLFVLSDSKAQNCRLKLLDFGIAQVAPNLWGGVKRRQKPSFTPAYGAPEQFSTAYGPSGPWTDVYALALVVVELVTGVEPLGAGAISELAERSCNAAERPTPHAFGVAVDDGVERVLRHALAVMPADRFANARDFWRALAEAAAAPAVDRLVRAGMLRDVSLTHAIPLVSARRVREQRWRRSAAAMVGAGVALALFQHWTMLARAFAALR